MSVRPQPLYLLLGGPRPSTSSSQANFTAWLHLEISKPSTSSSHLRLLYSSCRVASGRIQVGVDLGLNHLGNSRAYTPKGQLQTMSEHQHPTPSQLILQGGWRLMVSGYNQSLQLTGLGKYFPFTCQQQLRLNYKRRVYSAHTEGAPGEPSLGDRGSWATGPYSILRHRINTGNQSSST